ncbi:MAG: DUF438 domain-containing protein [Chloroflexi bacterium]|nr:DUF438 domain-containing protein [Chloroflexota bacterium]
MNAVKTIDIKGLGHTEKEALLFPGVQSLQPGETARIVVEFNPIPLVYMLKAQGEYDISYEKEGPDEWVLNVTRVVSRENKKEQFKELLQEMKEGEVSETTKVKAKELLQAVDATTLGLMEQELIREGVSHDEIRKSLCDIHLEVMRDSLVAKRIDVQSPHPVHTLMEEHKIIIKTLNELSEVMKWLRLVSDYKSMGERLESLKDISHHLVEAEKHHQREEDVLFPKLEEHDVVEPPEIMKLDHVEFRKRKKALEEVTHNHTAYSFPEFKAKVLEFGEYLTEQLESHIFKEDNILYQIAIQVLSDEEWKEIKQGCDKIGYCCFTPAESV